VKPHLLAYIQGARQRLQTLPLWAIAHHVQTDVEAMRVNASHRPKQGSSPL
jgi:hypothetical protein